jgi:hypothetical protein
MRSSRACFFSASEAASRLAVRRLSSNTARKPVVGARRSAGTIYW